MAEGFADFGFGVPSREDVIKQRTLQETQMFNELIAEQAASVAPQQRGVFSAFAGLGRALLGKPVAELTQKEKSQFGIIESANNKMREMQNTPEWGALDPTERAFRTQEAIGTAAAENGDIMTASSVAMSVAQARTAHATAQAKLLELSAKKHSQELKDDKTRADISRLNNDQVKAYVIPDANGNFGDSARTSNTITGTLKDGVLIGTDGKEYTNYLSHADFQDKVRSVAAETKAAKTGGGSKGTDWSKAMPSLYVNKVLGTKDASALRSSGTSVGRLLTLTNAAQDALMKSPESVAGGSGTFLSGLTNVVGAMRGVVSSFTNGENVPIVVGGTEDAEGNIVGGTATSLAEMTEKYAGSLLLPKGVEEDSEQAQLYRSSMMELFYINALALEPGSKALSDQDIRNQMEALGGNSANPRVVMQLLLANARTAASKVTKGATLMRNRAKNDGYYDPDKAVAALFDKDEVEAATTGISALETRVSDFLNPKVKTAAPTTTSPSGATTFRGGIRLVPQGAK